MAIPTSVEAVREYIGTSSAIGQFGPGPIGSNIIVATAALQRATHRQFDQQTSTTKKFTTRARASLTIPDLQSTTSVVLNGAPLVADSTYYLIPDVNNSGIFVAIDLPQYRDPLDYRTYFDWFDKGYDSPLAQARLRNPLPNDLVIGPATWGWPSYPPEFSLAAKILAAWLTKRPDAVLSNVLQTPGGDVLDVSNWPPEVTKFVADWKIDTDAAVTV